MNDDKQNPDPSLFLHSIKLIIALTSAHLSFVVPLFIGMVRWFHRSDSLGGMR